MLEKRFQGDLFLNRDQPANWFKNTINRHKQQLNPSQQTLTFVHHLEAELTQHSRNDLLTPPHPTTPSSLLTGEVQPELQVQGAHRGERLQHVRLPPLEAQRPADVRLAERAGEAAAGSQGSTETPVHPLPAHAALLAARVRTLTPTNCPTGSAADRLTLVLVAIFICLLLFHPPVA